MNNAFGEISQQQRAEMGYPNVPFPAVRDWAIPLPDYQPVEYTAPSVRRAVPDVDMLDQDVDGNWERARRISVCLTLLRDPQNGRPLNPAGRTGISGHGRLRNLGPNPTGDLYMTWHDMVLLITRTDSGQLAPTGGFLNALPDGSYEDPLEGAIREAYEEATIRAAGAATLISRGVIEAALRNTDNAWIENTSFHIDITDDADSPPEPLGQDDAREARWYNIWDVDVTRMSANHAADLFAVRQMLEQQR